MTKKVISYRLNTDGSIPDFVESGGHLPKDANDTSVMICIGIAKEGADISDAVQEFITEADATAYVSTYMNDSIFPGLDGKDVVFTVAGAVSDIFDKAKAV
jgi:hypothetical protein